METVKYRLTGIAGLLMHNAQLADPLNPFAKALAKISAKRQKTEEDYIKMADIEMEGGLWLIDERPGLPVDTIRKCLIEGARVSKRGKDIESGVFPVEGAPVEYEGEQDMDKFIHAPTHRHRASVKVGQSRVMRTRPHFPVWAATVELMYAPDILDEDVITQAWEDAGARKGIGDHRPVFGRFIAEKMG